MARTALLDRLVRRGQKLGNQAWGDVARQFADDYDLLHDILNSMIEGVIVVEADLEVRFMNRAAARFLGVRQQEAVHTDLAVSLTHPELLGLIRLSADSGQLYLDQEMEFTEPVRRPLAVSVIPMAETDASDRRVLVLLLDLSQRKETEAKLLHAEKLGALTHVAAGLAHEIRNPLNALSIHAQLLHRALQRLPEAALGTAGREVQESARVIREEIERLGRVVEQFLNAVRPTPRRFTQMELDQLIGSVLEVMLAELDDAGVQVSCTVDRAPVLVAGDETQLRQVFQNLVKNSLQAMPYGGQLSIRISGSDHAVRTTIQDSGVGIAPEDLPKIFEAYYTTRAEGTGLGLMHVRETITRHGGAVQVESEPGRGTVVTVTLPAVSTGPRLLSQPSGPAVTPEPEPASAHAVQAEP